MFMNYTLTALQEVKAAPFAGEIVKNIKIMYTMGNYFII